MNNDPPKRAFEEDRELEREIRAERKFSLAEAIGRLAGPGAMKGVSPVTGLQQAETVIHEYLNAHMLDAPGVLPIVLLRVIKGSELLLKNLDQPLVVLAAYLQRILGSDYLLKEFVRETDVEWGRTLGERPFFEQEGRPPHPDDPYTVESVRTALALLLDKLEAGDTHAAK